MDYTEYIQKKMFEKGINTETQDYIIKYVTMNQKLFGNYLDIDKVVSRILNNLNYSITSVDKTKNPLNKLIRITTSRGRWSPYDNKILINPIYKLLSKISQRQKVKIDSTVFHEIDHCATTEYIKIDKQEKDQYILNYLKKNNIKNNNMFIKYINTMYEQHKGVLPVSGIQDARQLIDNDINLRNLNEGITAYKQELYDKALGNKPHTAYKNQKKVAKFIGSIIGQEDLISMHFNNDYNGIRKSFNEKTGQDLNDLVKILNKKSTLTILFGNLYTNYFSKRVEKYIKQYEITEYNRNRSIQSKVKSFRESLSVDQSIETKKQFEQEGKQQDQNKVKEEDVER